MDALFGKAGKFKNGAKMEVDLNHTDLQLEKGILTNAQTFKAVFERIFMKYDRVFDRDEDGGTVIDFTTNDTLENDITRFKDISSEELEDEDVIITGEDQLDPELTARLHERVLQIKKEIHWSEDEQDDEDIPIDPLTSVLSPEYIDINSCSDTCDSDFEEEPPPTPPSPRFLGSNKLSHSVLIKSTPLLESNTNNGSSPSTSLIKCSRRFPVLEVKRTPVHKRRATEPYPSNSNNVTHLPHHYHPQRNDHPSSIDSYSCPHCCVLPVQVQYSCDCPSCRLQRSNICMCPSCMDSLPALSDHPFTFYSAPSPPCLCVTCSDQQSLLNSSAPLSQPFHCNRPASYSNAHGVDCCSCQEAGCDESSSLHLADLTRGKRQLEEDFNSPPVTKRPCT